MTFPPALTGSLIIKALEPLLIAEMEKLRHWRGTTAGSPGEVVKGPTLETTWPCFQLGALTLNSLLQESRTPGVTDISHGNADICVRG